GEVRLLDRRRDRALLRAADVERALDAKLVTSEAVDEAELRARRGEDRLGRVAFIGPDVHLRALLLVLDIARGRAGVRRDEIGAAVLELRRLAVEDQRLAAVGQRPFGFSFREIRVRSR